MATGVAGCLWGAMHMYKRGCGHQGTPRKCFVASNRYTLSLQVIAMFNYSPCGRRGLRLPLQRHLGALCRLPPLEGSLTADCKQESMHADQPPEEVTKK